MGSTTLPALSIKSAVKSQNRIEGKVLLFIFSLVCLIYFVSDKKNEITNK